MRGRGRHRRNCECPHCRGDTPTDDGGGRDWTLLRHKLSAKLAAGLAIVLLLVLTAVASAAVGYKIGMDDRYGWQATSSIGFHVAPTSSRFPLYVTRTGNYTVGGYSFVLGTDQHPKLTGTMVGYAQPGGRIYLETNRRLTKVYETCVHERLHQTHPSAPHNWIYDVEGRVVDETCLKLLYRLG